MYLNLQYTGFTKKFSIRHQDISNLWELQITVVVLFVSIKNSQLTFTCSNSTIETPEKEVKYVSKLTIKTPEHISLLFLVFQLLTLNK